MHFGYRIFDEISRYLSNNRENGMLTFDDAFGVLSGAYPGDYLRRLDEEDRDR